MAMPGNPIFTWPPSTSAIAAPLPLYETCVTMMPAIDMNSSPNRCCPPPPPEEAQSSLPGWGRASAMSSLTDFTPSDGCTTSTFGEEANIATCAKSFSVS